MYVCILFFMTAGVCMCACFSLQTHSSAGEYLQ